EASVSETPWRGLCTGSFSPIDALFAGIISSCCAGLLRSAKRSDRNGKEVSDGESSRISFDSAGRQIQRADLFPAIAAGSRRALRDFRSTAGEWIQCSN